MGIYFTAYLYYMDHVIRATGLEATIADTGSMVLVLAVLPMIGTQVKRIGGKRSIFLSLVPYLLGLGVLFAAATWWQVTIAYVLIQLGRYTASTAGGPLGAAIIDENERITGTRKTGLFGAVSALLLAPVGGLQMILFMGILKATGYAEGTGLQSAEAVMGIRLAAAAVPMGFALLGMIPLALFPYDRKKEAELSLFSQLRRAGQDVVPDAGE
jgi:GPH family glycoside/pentoside/hexuronide:cation symporter